MPRAATRELSAEVLRVIADARTRAAEGRVPEALAMLGTECDERTRRGDHFSASNIAHVAGVIESDPGRKLEWNERAIVEAEVEPDRASVEPFWASLYNNLGVSYALLGDRLRARDCFERAWRHAKMLEPGPYADAARAAIGRRLDELWRDEAPETR